MRVLRYLVKRRLFSNCTIRCSTTWTTDWLNVAREIQTEAKQKKYPPTVGLAIKRIKKKKKQRQRKIEQKHPNTKKTRRKWKKNETWASNQNLKTQCADQSHLAPFISYFLLKSNAGLFPLFLSFLSFLVVSRGAVPGERIKPGEGWDLQARACHQRSFILDMDWTQKDVSR